MTAPFSSSSTWVCAPAETDSAAIRDAGTPAFSRRRGRAVQTATHQLSGSCSLQPLWGADVVTGAAASAITAPAASISVTFSDPAPRSIPRKRSLLTSTLLARCCRIELTDDHGAFRQPQAELARVHQIARVKRILDLLQ